MLNKIDKRVESLLTMRVTLPEPSPEDARKPFRESPGPVNTSPWLGQDGVAHTVAKATRIEIVHLRLLTGLPRGNQV